MYVARHGDDLVDDVLWDATLGVATNAASSLDGSDQVLS
jgi:hypothetical protein